MKDQAEKLRMRLREHKRARQVKTLAVVSGKGGVGKSSFSLNFSISLCNQGRRVLLVDMDIGMGNLDILMGKNSSCSIADYIEHRVSLQETVMDGPNDLRYIAGGSGLSQLVHLGREGIDELTRDLKVIVDSYDYVIFDMGAGVNEDSLAVILSVDTVLVVMTPEPTSLMDAYATMKHIHLMKPELPFHIVVNRAQSEKEGTFISKRMMEVLSRFLGREAFFLGTIPDDRTVQAAVKKQVPFLIDNHKSAASKAINVMAKRYDGHMENRKPPESGLPFVSKLKKLLFERQGDRHGEN